VCLVQTIQVVDDGPNIIHCQNDYKNLDISMQLIAHWNKINETKITGTAVRVVEAQISSRLTAHTLQLIS